MPDFSDEEKELLRFAGVEGLKFLMNLYRTTQAKGIDLENLIERAEAKNRLTIFDDNV